MDVLKRILDLQRFTFLITIYDERTQIIVAVLLKSSVLNTWKFVHIDMNIILISHARPRSTSVRLEIPRGHTHH
jgi:hypothetical protein